MLKPEDLETIADGVQELWGEFEEDILKDIAERIKNCNYKINATAAWRLSILEDLNEQSDYVTQQLAKYLETSEKQVKDIINNTVIDQVKSDKAMYEEAKDEGLIERSDFTPGTINSIVSKGIKATNGTIRNFTKSTVTNSNTQLTHYLDLAYLNVQSGNMSIDEAVKNSVDQLAGKGVIENVYNGRTEQIETVVGRAVRTGTNMTVGRSTLAIADDLGCDLVEVSSHLGARPTHAIWQGKVYSRSGKGNIYPDFVKSTGYGTGEGLLGWNCRHTFYPYFKGLSTVSSRQYSLKENAEVYKLQQQQRYNERKIREYKKKAAIELAGGQDPTVYEQLASKWTDRNDALISANTDVLKPNWSKTQIGSYSKQTLTKISSNYSVKSFSRDILSEEAVDIDGRVIKAMQKSFPGYNPISLSTGTGGEYSVEFRKIGENMYKVSSSIELYAGSMNGHVALNSVELASSIHERAHEIVSQIAMRRSGFDNGDVIGPLKLNIFKKEYEKVIEGAYLVCFDKQSLVEIRSFIEMNISRRASDSGAEFISEAMVMAAKSPDNKLAKTLYNYLIKEWKK